MSSGGLQKVTTRPTVVFVASEAVPFAKTGGLADVTGALLSELAVAGCVPCAGYPVTMGATAATPSHGAAAAIPTRRDGRRPQGGLQTPAR